MKRIILLGLLVAALLIPFTPCMALNDLTGQTWVLDSVGSIITTPVHIVWIIWTNITTDGDDLEIHEKASGDLIVKLKGLAGVDMIVPFPGNSGYLPSIYLTTRDSGAILVRLGKAQ